MNCNHSSDTVGKRKILNKDIIYFTCDAEPELAASALLSAVLGSLINTFLLVLTKLEFEFIHSEDL